MTTLRGVARTLAAQSRRAERESKKREREYAKQQKQIARMEELEAARYEVSIFENHLSLITSVHVDCGPTWYWDEIRTRDEPQLQQVHTEKAQLKLDRFRPSIMDMLLQRTDRKRAALRRKVSRATQEDQDEHIQAVQDHHEIVSLAGGVIAGDPEAYAETVEGTGVFSELEDFGSIPKLTVHTSEVVSATVHVSDQSVIPSKTKSLLKSGKLSVKQTPKGRFFELYQDYVCGVALRIGRELMALLPISMVVSDVRSDMLNSATGHIEAATILSVAMPRATVDRLNFSALDPSDAMANFVNHMEFKKTKGFSVVEPIDASGFSEPESPLP